jgi:predicted small lipoprotein YifL
MRVVFRMSAIVAALSIGATTLVSLGGCGQRGPLYLPQVPPMPQRPADLQDTPASAAAPRGASATDEGDIPDTSGQALQLAPEPELKSAPAAPKAASSAE